MLLKTKIEQLLCEAVNINQNFDFTQERWFMDHSWNEQQEYDFAIKLFNHIKENKKAYRGQVLFLTVDKKLKKEIYTCTLLSGWTYSDPEIINRKISSFLDE